MSNGLVLQQSGALGSALALKAMAQIPSQQPKTRSGAGGQQVW